MGIRLLIGVVLVAWVVLNSLILSRYGKEFDPYPYILLNLFLSMLASIQAPTILMPVGRAAGDSEGAAQAAGRPAGEKTAVIIFAFKGLNQLIVAVL